MSDKIQETPRPIQVPLNDDTRAILGIPCFACGQVAEWLRSDGAAIERKAQSEQAAVIHWMLNAYLLHGSQWKDVLDREIARMRKAKKEDERVTT